MYTFAFILRLFILIRRLYIYIRCKNTRLRSETGVYVCLTLIKHIRHEIDVPADKTF